MKKFLNNIANSEFTIPTIGTFFWLIIFSVNFSIAWTDDPLTSKSFVRLLSSTLMLIINFLSLGECSKRRETKKIVDRLDILAKIAFSETKESADLDNYKKILNPDELEKFENIDKWNPCIFKPCGGQPGSHQCLDGLYNKSCQLFKLDPSLNIDKTRLSYTWKEDDVLEFTMKDID